MPPSPSFPRIWYGPRLLPITTPSFEIGLSAAASGDYPPRTCPAARLRRDRNAQHPSRIEQMRQRVTHRDDDVVRAGRERAGDDKPGRQEVAAEERGDVRPVHTARRSADEDR